MEWAQRVTEGARDVMQATGVPDWACEFGEIIQRRGEKLEHMAIHRRAK